jgi:hypothetical protein
MLLKLGFSRNTPLAVVYGAINFGDIAFRDLAIEQGIEQLCLIIQHIRSDTEQGADCSSLHYNGGNFWPVSPSHFGKIQQYQSHTRN